MSGVSDNKRIAYNTAFLSIKMVLSLFIGLYASRVILKALGASDYGLYSVVGGVVTLMNIIGTAMMAVTYRFICVELGKGDKGDTNRVFNATLIIYIVFIALMFLFGETLGLYYINHIANIDPEKLPDARFVLHFSLIATAFTMISIPYNGVIIARERFLFTSILEVGRQLIKLVLVIGLLYYFGNRLRLFALIIAFYNLITPVSLFIFNKIKDPAIIKWKLNTNKSDYIEIGKYAGWTLMGATARLGEYQGSNMVLNYFFNTLVNAAYGLAMQVNTYVNTFVSNLTQAAVPQIMKNQENNSQRSLQIVYLISRFAFMIMLLLTVPILLSINYILGVWLGNVPQYTNLFVSLFFLTGLVRSLSAGFDGMIQATGKLKRYQIANCTAYLSVLPLSCILYKLGVGVATIFLLNTTAAAFMVIFMAHYLTQITDFKGVEYFKGTIIPCFKVIIGVLPLYTLTIFFDDNLLGFILKTSISVIWVLIDIYILGLNSIYRDRIKNLMVSVFRKFK